MSKNNSHNLMAIYDVYTELTAQLIDIIQSDV